MSKSSSRCNTPSEDEREDPNHLIPSSLGSLGSSLGFFPRGVKKKYPIVVESALVLRERVRKKLEEREKRRQLREEENSFMERERRERDFIRRKEHDHRLRERERLSIKEHQCQQEKQKLQPNRQRGQDFGGLDQLESLIRSYDRSFYKWYDSSDDEEMVVERAYHRQSTPFPSETVPINSLTPHGPMTPPSSGKKGDSSINDEMAINYCADRDDRAYVGTVGRSHGESAERNVSGSESTSLRQPSPMSGEPSVPISSPTSRGPKTPPTSTTLHQFLLSDDMSVNEEHARKVEIDVPLDVNYNSLTQESHNISKPWDQHVRQDHQLFPVSAHLAGSCYERRVPIESTFIPTQVERASALSSACSPEKSVDCDQNRASGQPTTYEQSTQAVCDPSGDGGVYKEYCAECDEFVFSPICTDDPCIFRSGKNINPQAHP